MLCRTRTPQELVCEGTSAVSYALLFFLLFVSQETRGKIAEVRALILRKN